jgi:circadian clock protein KaiB
MTINESNETTIAFEKATVNAEPGNEKYILKLYITGMTPRSRAAVENIKKICREYLNDNYELEVVDVYQQPTLARGEQIIAAPTLIKKLPLPLRRLIGDMSQTDRVLLGLDIKKKRNK